jgi:hypothetical protein
MGGGGSSIYLSVTCNQGIYSNIFVGYVTDEYILIFLSTEKYNSLYSFVLCSSIILLVN